MSAKIFYCTHSKGGSGASLFSTNFAYALAQQNKKVLFLDANQFSDIAHFFNITAKKDILNLELFLKEYKNSKKNNNELKEIFAKTTYAIKNLDILLSPQNYYPSNKLNFLYQKIIKQAKKIYDYIIVDIEKNGKFLASKKFSSTETIFMITTVDNLSITKTNNFIDKLNEKNSLSNIKIIFNQTGNFSKEDLSSIFKTTSVCNLPTEINGAWDNICP